MTDRYAVFGNPVAHSKSPRIHALFAQQTGEDIAYDAILAPRDAFARTVQDFARQGARGANVTLPFKEEAFRLCDQRTARAEAAGAVNTLIFAVEDATLHVVGDNTDGAGLVRDITHNLGVSICDKRVLLLGSGGAARGVVLPLLHEMPRTLTIANRTFAKAQKLAAIFAAEAHASVDAATFDMLASKQYDIVINATSAGLADAALPLHDDIFASGCLAYDMLYGRDTPFMQQAHAAGATVSDGVGMLVEQAAEAFTVWRGVRPDTAPVLKLMRAST